MCVVYIHVPDLFVVVKLFISYIYSGTTKLEDAADLYVRAANQFKVAKSFESKTSLYPHSHH